ncbi:MAG: ECF-type sigma factor [Planctomycetota bacterium]
MDSPDTQFTRTLRQYADGDRAALDVLMPSIYEELRRLADGVFRRRSEMTIQPTVLVHEAYMRLAGAAQGWNDKQHFLAVAAKAMRQVLANHVRDKGAQKRGGGLQRVTLQDGAVSWARDGFDLEELHAALEALESLAPRRAEVVQLRFFSGMTIDETAAVLDVATSTVEADWALGRAWLRKRLSGAND